MKDSKSQRRPTPESFVKSPSAEGLQHVSRWEWLLASEASSFRPTTVDLIKKSPSEPRGIRASACCAAAPTDSCRARAVLALSIGLSARR